MSEGYEAMQGMMQQLRDLGQAPEEIAADIAPELRDELAENIAAGTTPDGTPWTPTAEGHKPLQGAADAMGVAAHGPRVLVALRGVYARHHFGRVRGGIARPILPSSKLPPDIVAMITRVAEKRFRLITGGS